jgi:integrase
MCGGEYLRKAVRTRDWDDAQRRVREAEARGSWEAPVQAEAGSEPEPLTIAEASAKFLQDAERGRRIADCTLRKYKLLLRDLEEFTARKGFRYLKELDLEALREFRETWFTGSEADQERKRIARKPLGPRTAMKKLERLRAFCRFCVEAHWMADNPAKLVRAPSKIKEVPKEPFTEDQMQRILAAAEQVDLEIGHTDELHATNDELITFILLLRHSGLRIGDASLLTTDRLEDSRLFLYTQKTGTHVYIPLPPYLVERLSRVRLKHGKYLFVGPASVRLETVADLWRRKLTRVFRAAQISKAHPHRFRHTFAVELLKKGVPLENVAVLLGHSSVKITERHYAAWVQARQDILEAQVAQTWSGLQIVAGGKKKTG